MAADDAEILIAARDAGLVFVTFDVHTIPEVLRSFAEAGTEHGGVVLVSTRSFRQDDIGGLIASLERLHHKLQREGSRNRVLYLVG